MSTRRRSKPTNPQDKLSFVRPGCWWRRTETDTILQIRELKPEDGRLVLYAYYPGTAEDLVRVEPEYLLNYYFPLAEGVEGLYLLRHLDD